jgi:hypothetical protein
MWPFQRRLAVSGEVLLIRLNVEMGEESENNDTLWTIAHREAYRLREDMAATVHEHLGPEFDVRSMSYARGSLEILVVVGTLYYAVSRYKSFVESIELCVAQLRRIVIAFFERRMPTPISVRGTWTPGPGLVQSNAGRLDMGDNGVVVWYLVLSHAAMLTVILWLLLNVFRRATP